MQRSGMKQSGLRADRTSKEPTGRPTRRARTPPNLETTERQASPKLVLLVAESPRRKVRRKGANVKRIERSELALNGDHTGCT